MYIYYYQDLSPEPVISVSIRQLELHFLVLSKNLGKVIKGKGNRLRSPVGCGHNLLLSADTEKMRDDTNFKLQRVQ